MHDLPKILRELKPHSSSFDDISADLVTLAASSTADNKLAFKIQILEEQLFLAHNREDELMGRIRKLEKEKEMLWKCMVDRTGGPIQIDLETDESSRNQKVYSETPDSQQTPLEFKVEEAGKEAGKHSSCYQPA